MTGIQLFLAAAAVVLCSAATAAILLHCFNKRLLVRIEGLTRYLEAINLGRESALPRIEDNFSHLEDELYKTVGELRQSKENATAERQTMADNLADIAHQIKTPITSMSLMTQLAAEVQNEESSVYIQRLSVQLARLESLANALLTLSRLDAGALTFSHEAVDLYSLLTAAAEPVQELIQQRGQSLAIPVDSELLINADMGWSSEALLNLIKNCSEHTPYGGSITTGYSQNPLYTEIVIEDDGDGFELDDLPNIFRRFYRGKNANKDSIGIGLALSRSLIEAQGGTLYAENRKTHGARFVVKFYNIVQL